MAVPKTIKKVREKSSKRKRKLIPQQVKDLVWNRDGGICVECGSNEKLQFDHIIPHSKNGPDTYPNLQLLCKYCNVRKHAKIVKKGEIKNDVHKQLKKLKRYTERKEEELEEASIDIRRLYNIEEKFNEKLEHVKRENLKPPKNATEVYDRCVDDLEEYLMVEPGIEWEEGVLPLDSDLFFDNLDELIDKKVEEYDLYSWPYPDWMLDEYKNDKGEVWFIDNVDWKEVISERIIDVYQDLTEDGMFDSCIEESKNKDITPLDEAIQKQKDFINHDIKK